MTFEDLPRFAAWHHDTSRTGFESVGFRRTSSGWLAVGSTSAVEGDQPWWVAYEIELSELFVTRRATVIRRSGCDPPTTTALTSDGAGSWSVDGTHTSLLDGCLDVDLEASAMTNALPLRRMPIAVGETMHAPATYVRVHEPSVERLEQQYRRVDDVADGSAYDYHAAAFDFSARITYDRSGLVMSYPGIARRAV